MSVSPNTDVMNSVYAHIWYCIITRFVYFYKTSLKRSIQREAPDRSEQEMTGGQLSRRI